MPYFDDEGEVDCGHDEIDFCGVCKGCRECCNCYCEEEEDNMYTLGLEPRGA